MIAFERRFPLGFGTWRRNLPWHLLGSFMYSIARVLSMVGLRKPAYALAGEHYDFGDWSRIGSSRNASCAFTAATSSTSSTWRASSRSRAATRSCN